MGSGLKTALFVDFDNIFLSLRNEASEAIALRFANDPGRWIKWLESTALRHDEEEGAHRKRRTLIRNCYLNPGPHGRFRSAFTSAAFRVIDCPSVTMQGKNSADIHMVMDILDTLASATHIDEFIIFSGDADFRPVLLRLRAYDRRTVILTVGPSSAAFEGASDYVIRSDDFIEKGLGFAATPAPAATALPSSRPIVIKSAAVERPGPGEGEGPAFREPRLDGTPPVPSAGRGPVTQVIPSGVPIDRDAVGEEIHGIVSRSPVPIPLARLAHHLDRVLGDNLRDSNWLGFGSFKRCVESFADLGIAVSNLSSGLVYDPARHELPAAPKEESGASGVVERVSRQTGAPRRTTEEYACVFEAIDAVLGNAPYQIVETSRAVRDACAERGHAVSRGDVSFILKGIWYRRAALLTGDRSTRVPGRLAGAFCANVLQLSDNMGLDLSDAERDEVTAWITGESVETLGRAAVAPSPDAQGESV
jgi:hypothetical protein